MKLPVFLRSITTAQAYEDDLQSQREKILFNILLGMSIVGFGLLLSYYPYGIQQQRWETLIVFTLIYVWAVSVTFIRRLPYNFRTASLLLIIYLLGLITTMQDSFPGNGRVYLLGFSIITGILMGLKRGVAAIVLSVATLVTANVLMKTGVLQRPEIDLGAIHDNVAFWALSVAAFLAVSVTTTISIVTLLHGLERSLSKEKTLSKDLELQRFQLEENVRKRTQDVERRMVQIHTAAEISRTISAVHDPNELLVEIVDLLRERFDLYYVGVFLIDVSGDYAVLSAGTGEAGQRMVAEGHRLVVGGASMIGWAIANKKPRLALDVGQEAVRFINPHLPLTRSELALPLMVGERIFGAITIQSGQPEAFDEEDIAVFMGTADSLAIALENARIIRQSQESLKEIQALHQEYLIKAWSDVKHTEGPLSSTYEVDSAPSEGETTAIEMPVSLRNQVIGLLEMEGNRGPLSPEEMVYVEAVTTEAAVALENVRLLSETQNRAERERQVSEITSKVRSSTEVDTVLQTILREVGRVMRASSGIIQLDIHTDTATESANNGSEKTDDGESGAWNENQ